MAKLSLSDQDIIEQEKTEWEKIIENHALLAEQLEDLQEALRCHPWVCEVKIITIKDLQRMHQDELKRTRND